MIAAPVLIATWLYARHCLNRKISQINLNWELYLNVILKDLEYQVTYAPAIIIICVIFIFNIITNAPYLKIRMDYIYVYILTIQIILNAIKIFITKKL